LYVTSGYFFFLIFFPGRPDSVIVHFEESPDQMRVLHPTLDIKLIGRPRLVPGKVGNALELRGRGPYADLGMLSHKCMGNLARCVSIELGNPFDK
jgi:hypothetical protein